MSMATGTDRQSAAVHVADRHDLIRVHGARVNNLFSRLGKPHVGSPEAFAFNVPSVRASGSITVAPGEGKTKAVKATFNRLGGMCPRCEGMGRVSDFELTQMYDESKSLNEGALTIPASAWTAGSAASSAAAVSSTRTSGLTSTPRGSCRTCSTRSRPRSRSTGSTSRIRD
jgi:hypothetical protein